VRGERGRRREGERRSREAEGRMRGEDERGSKIFFDYKISLGPGGPL
jgi:hypothetical protein